MQRLLLFALVLTGCFLEPDRPGGPTMMPPSGQAQLAAGDRFACVIRDGGALACWGEDNNGQLGVLPVQDHLPTPQTALGTGWTAIAAGSDFACGLAGTTLKCWGTIAGLTQAPPTEVTLPGGAQPAKIFASDSAMCAIDGDGNVYCYGFLNQVQYDNPTKLAIGGVPGPWTSMALAYEHACALNNSGTAYCWGDKGYFLGGADDKTPHTVDDAQPILGFTFDSIAAYQGVTCGVTAQHELACGGAAVFRIGPASGDGPVAAIDTRTTWQQLAVGSSFGCGIIDGHVECYGYGVGVLGDGFGGRDSFGGSVYAHASSVVAGNAFACASDGTDVSCWGSNEFGEMGNGKTAVTYAPTDPVPLPAGTYTSIITSTGRTCVLIDGIPYCWGNNNAGQSLPGAGQVLTNPAQAASTQLTSLVGGDEHTCGVTMNGAALHCWGVGDAVQLNSPGTKDIPPPASATWASLAASDVTTCAAGTDNNIYCLGVLPWKANYDSTPIVTMSPITGDGVAAGGYNVAAITSGQSSIAYAGKLCDHAPITMTVGATSAMFTQVKSSADTSQFGSPSGHICALDASAGNLWCFGENGSAQVSSSANSCEPAPVKIPLTGVTAFSLAGRHSCAIASGALSCWGQNENGELGPTNIGASLDAPSRIDSTSWTDVGAGAQTICGINADGNVYCWGLNIYGEVGVGEHFHPTPTPVQF